MADHPIIFSAPMVRALLNGRKSMTRRVLKPQPEFRGGYGDYHDAEEWGWEDEDGYHVSVLDIAPNGYRVGDRLWVREAFRGDKGYDAYPPREWSHWPVHYEADGERDAREGMGADGKLRSPIHMPRWASRLTLIVTDVRVQRVQEISRGDAMEEGCPFQNMADGPDPRHWFRDLWNSLHGQDAWDANPWVAAITFTVQYGNIDGGRTDA